MKKAALFSLFIATACALQAQVLFDEHMLLPKMPTEENELVLSLDKVFKKVSRDSQIAIVDKKVFEKDEYTTKEFYHKFYHDDPEFTEEDGFDVLDPKVEQKTTKGYVEVTYRIPPGYDIVPNVNEEGNFECNTYNAIELFLLDSFVMFKLDYKIRLESPELQRDIDMGALDELCENQFTKKENAKLITIKYTPHYFTLKQDYPYPDNVPNKIGIHTKIRPIFSVKYKDKYGTSFYLVPNIKNIYRDFKFVKNGPSPYIYEKIEEEEDNVTSDVNPEVNAEETLPAEVNNLP